MFAPSCVSMLRTTPWVPSIAAALIRVVDDSGTTHPGGFSRRRRDVGDTEPRRTHSDRVELDLELSHLSTKDRNAGNAGYSQQSGLDRPVCEGALVHQRPGSRGEPDDQHRSGAGGERRHHRCLCRRGQSATSLRQPLRDRLPRAIDVRSFGEKRGDDRQSLDRLRSHAGDSRHAVDRVLDRSRDQHLHLFRSEARSFGLDGHSGRRKFREHIVACGGEHAQAIEEKHPGEDDDDAPETDRKANDGAQHCFWIIDSAP